MKKLGKAASFAVILAAVAALAASSATSRGSSSRDFDARLSGFREVPAVSTTGRGRLDVDLANGVLRYRLSYSRLEADALFAHIHFAQARVNGGVIAFLCGGGDKPACPARGGTVTGTIDPADVIGPEEQGIAPGEFAEVVRAMRAVRTYANVHTTKFPQGEIRGQIHRD